MTADDALALPGGAGLLVQPQEGVPEVGGSCGFLPIGFGALGLAHSVVLSALFLLLELVINLLPRKEIPGEAFCQGDEDLKGVPADYGGSPRVDANGGGGVFFGRGTALLTETSALNLRAEKRCIVHKSTNLCTTDRVPDLKGTHLLLLLLNIQLCSTNYRLRLTYVL